MKEKGIVNAKITGLAGQRAGGWFLLAGEKPKNKTTERNPFDGFGRGTRT